MMLAGLSPMLEPNPKPVSTGANGSGAFDGIENFEGRGMLGGIMDAEDGRSMRRRDKIGSQSADEFNVNVRMIAKK
jgi:hypothetical protein